MSSRLQERNGETVSSRGKDHTPGPWDLATLAQALWPNIVRRQVGGRGYPGPLPATPGTQDRGPGVVIQYGMR
jgi:hypothetical protein